MRKVSKLVGEQVYEDVKLIAAANIDWERLKDKTVLITGANGFIAYYLVLALLLKSEECNLRIKVLGLVRNIKRAEEKYGEILEREDIKLFEQDVCEELKNIPHADLIIHAASQATPYYFENDPVGTLEANTTGTTNILQFAVREKAETVLLISSLKVYGKVQNGLSHIREEDQGYIDIDDYKNCYAMGKRVMETLCSSYAKQYNLDVKIARPSYIYGASTLEDDRVWAQFLANIIRHENILLKSNGAAYRSFCYVTDTAAALLYILMNGKSSYPYNIASEHSDITIRNFAKAAIEVFPERRIELVFANKEDEVEPGLDFGKETPEILSAKRIQELGWNAEIDIREGIRRSVLTMEERTK